MLALRAARGRAMPARSQKRARALSRGMKSSSELASRGQMNQSGKRKRDIMKDYTIGVHR